MPKYAAIAMMLVTLSMAGVTSAAVMYDLVTEVTANGGWPSDTPTIGTWSAGSTETIGSFDPFVTFSGGGPTVWQTTTYKDAGHPYNSIGAAAGQITPHTYFEQGAVVVCPNNDITGTDNILDPGEIYNLYSLIRWTAPATMAADQAITLDVFVDTTTFIIYAPTNNKLSDTWVVKNGDILFEKISTNPETDFGPISTDITVSPGDTIDILGKRNVEDDGYHSCLFAPQITITVVPEPSTLVLLSAGLLGLFVIARRKKK